MGEILKLPDRSGVLKLKRRKRRAPLPTTSGCTGTRAADGLVRGPRRRPKNKRSNRFSLFLVQRQTEGKNGAAAGFDAGTDFAGVVFDNLPANGKAESGALRPAVSGEGLEQARHYLRRNTSASIFDFRDHLLVRLPEAKSDRAAVGHRVTGVVNNIEKNVGQTLRIDQQADCRWLIFQLDRHGLRGGFGPEFFEELADEIRVIALGENHGRGRAAREFQQLVNHVAEPVDLLADAVPGSATVLARRVVHRRHFSGDPDYIERVFEIVDDGAGEAAHQSES